MLSAVSVVSLQALFVEIAGGLNFMSMNYFSILMLRSNDFTSFFDLSCFTIEAIRSTVGEISIFHC